MIEPLLRRFISYKKRKQTIIIGTILTALVIVWPAVDEYIAARQRTSAAQSQLQEANEQVGKLDDYAALHKRKLQELARLEARMAPEKVAQALQNQLTELGRQTGCTVRKARLGEAARRPWMEKDDPIRGMRTSNSGGQTPFLLETRQLALTVSGPMSGLYNFLDRLHRIDRIMHSRTVTIQRSNEDGSTAELTIDLLLFNLSKKAART